MKHILIIAIICLSFTGQAQTKKAPTKKPVVKTEIKPVKQVVQKEEATHSPCTADNAGKYAKALSNKMYYTQPVYGDQRRGLNVQIQNWKSVQTDDGAWYYFVKLTLSWQEGTGGWGDWKDVKYVGTVVFDQFGCNALYLINEKHEPSILGIIKRARKLTEEQRQILSAKDDWTADVQYYWEPEGCLE